MGKTTQPTRIPLVYESDAPRDSSKIVDWVYIQNGYVEKHADGKMRVHKRRATQLETTLVYGNGQGLARYDGHLWNVNGDRLVWTEAGSPPNMAATCAAWTTQGASVPYGWTYGARMIAFKNKLWRIGGGYVLGGWPVSNIFSTTNGVDWVSAGVACPWGARSGFGLVEYAGKLWLFGGWDGTTYKNDVWSSQDAVNWVLEAGTTAWVPRHDFGFVASNDGIYLVGGVINLGLYRGDAWYTTDGITWVQTMNDADAAPVYRRAYFDMLFFNNKIWVIGGYRNGVTYMNNVVSSPDGRSWTEETAAAFGSGRYSGSCTVYNGKMWHIAGITAIGAVSEVYSSTSGTAWTNVGNIPENKYGATIALWRSYAAPVQSKYETVWIFAGTAGLTTYSATLNTATGSLALSVLTAGERFRFAETALGASLVLKNRHRVWVFNGSTATLVTSPNIPQSMVDGIAVLDDYVFVMDAKGVIYNSKLNNPLEWNSLDFITAEYASDSGVYITRYLNYIVAMKERTVQFFQDVGNPLGSPLQPILNATLQIGCFSGDTVAHIDNVMFWIGSGSGGLAVYMLEGFNAKMVSIPSVAQQITKNSAGGFKCAAFKSDGHSFYSIATQTGGSKPAYVYDITVGTWYIWLNAGGHWNYFDAVDLGGSATYFCGTSEIVVMDDASNDYTDSVGAVSLVVQTPSFDFNTNRLKRMNRAELISTKPLSSTTTTIQYSDDDGQTWSSSLSVNEASQQPAVWRLGAFRKRKFLVSNNNTGVEWEAIECEVVP